MQTHLEGRSHYIVFFALNATHNNLPVILAASAVHARQVVTGMVWVIAASVVPGIGSVIFRIGIMF